ncbi:uncharacterized protein LOC123274430 [Cotesia glomerata]|uniref:uncharacterized protein LOC123274430 n=1 Tax=Cotesia glomerata TaxID=32391 RepID=UPI001D035144|nr:uncharacterized protein LOC123274430 [Cotesia glomerata]
MGRRKIMRTAAEGECIKKSRREQEKERIRHRRVANIQLQNPNVNDVPFSDRLTTTNIAINIESADVRTLETVNRPLSPTSYDFVHNLINNPGTSNNSSSSFTFIENDPENNVTIHDASLPSESPSQKNSYSSVNSSLPTTTEYRFQTFDHDYCSSSILNCNTARMSFAATNSSPLPSEDFPNQYFSSDHDYCERSCPESTSTQYRQFDHNYSMPNEYSDSTIPTTENFNGNAQPWQMNNNINSTQEYYIGQMNVKCRHCNAKHFVAEKVANKHNSFNNCCRHGEVVLEPHPEFPELLKSLFLGNHTKSKNFFERIRNFNSSFSFASFNANLTNFSSQRSGPYCFKIQGQIYYQVNTSLYPSSNESPSYGQLFIIDPTESAQYRSERNVGCDVDLLQEIDLTLRQYNIFAQSYQMMKDVLQDNSTNNSDGQVIEPELNLLFTLKPGMDVRRYNFQRVNEVAAVFSTTADGEIPDSYVTIQNKTTKTFQYLSTMDPNTEPWVYPLFYPHGNQGWHKSIPYKIKTNRTVTRADYYKYKLAIRDDFNVFLMGRRLTQQWIVDSYVKIEKDRLNYCKFNQKKLRAE